MSPDPSRVRRAARVVLAGVVDGSVRRLQGLQFGGGRLEAEPRGVAGELRDFDICNGGHAEILT